MDVEVAGSSCLTAIQQRKAVYFSNRLRNPKSLNAKPHPVQSAIHNCMTDLGVSECTGPWNRVPKQQYPCSKGLQ